MQPGIGGKISVDILLGFLSGNPQILGQTEGRDPVDDSEVDRLSVRPLLIRDLFKGSMENQRGCRPVNVLSLPIGLDQPGILGQMRQYAKLNLRVIGIDKDAALHGGENPADLLAELHAYGDILQIRLRRGETSGGRHCLLKRTMYPTIVRNHLGQSIRVRRLELCQLAKLQDISHNLIIDSQRV